MTQIDHNSGSSGSSATATATGRKRQAEGPLEVDSNRKRAATKNSFALSSDLLGYSSSGSSIAPDAQESEEDEDSEFLDVSETQDDESTTSMKQAAANQPEEGARDSCRGEPVESITEGESKILQTVNEDVNDEEMSDIRSQKTDNEDLFENTFGRRVANETDHEDVESHYVDGAINTESQKPDEKINSNEKKDEVIVDCEKTEAVDDEDPFTKALRARGLEFIDGEHTPGCSCNYIRRASTPPLAHGQGSSAPVQLPNRTTYVSRHLTMHYRLHIRAMELIPRLKEHHTLDWPRRYWIAVLLEGKKPKNANSEKDFIWMKGNKFSTVSTIWHKYQTTTMADPDDLVLMLGREHVEFKDEAQHLDYFADRLLVFRALKKNSPEAVGKSLVEGVIKEVIDLEDN